MCVKINRVFSSLVSCWVSFNLCSFPVQFTIPVLLKAQMLNRATGSKEKGRIAPFDGSAGLQKVKLFIELECQKVCFECQKNWHFHFP